MNLTDPGANLVTFILFVMGVLVVLSILTLLRYFFGGKSPLRWNAEARVEAAQNPANVLQADREYQYQRMLRWLLFWLTLGIVFYTMAPDELIAVLKAVGVLFEEVFSVLGDSITTLRDSRGG